MQQFWQPWENISILVWPVDGNWWAILQHFFFAHICDSKVNTQWWRSTCARCRHFPMNNEKVFVYVYQMDFIKTRGSTFLKYLFFWSTSHRRKGERSPTKFYGNSFHRNFTFDPGMGMVLITISSNDYCYFIFSFFAQRCQK